MLSPTRPLPNHPKDSVALGISAIRSARIHQCSYWDESSHKGTPFFTFLETLNFEVLRESYDPKNVTFVSLKEAGRAWQVLTCAHVGRAAYGKKAKPSKNNCFGYDAIC